MTVKVHLADLPVEGYGNPVDDLVDKLSRPIYNLRMANGSRYRGHYMTKSARTRAIKARREIDEIVKSYCEGEE